jgi:hypothetical protein
MKALGFLVLTCAFLAATALPMATRAQAESERVVSGELVATNASANQFRIVGYPGSFTAPAGTSVTALDGHTVRVEMSSSGHVLQVVDTPVPINPVQHGWSAVRGELRVADAATGRFSFAGDDQSYVAPSSINIAPYNGHYVEIKIDDTGRVAEIHPMDAQAPAQPQSWNPPPYPPVSVGTCIYLGQAYSSGASVCQSGTQYRCDGTQWQSMGSPCERSTAYDSSLPAASPRDCIVGDATVANGSGICRGGITYRCDDGTWVSMQTACR